MNEMQGLMTSAENFAGQLSDLSNRLLDPTMLMNLSLLPGDSSLTVKHALVSLKASVELWLALLERAELIGASQQNVLTILNGDTPTGEVKHG